MSPAADGTAQPEGAGMSPAANGAARSEPAAVVVGAGAAGVAAALALRARGVTPRVLMAGSGASALFGGTLDLLPWEREATPPTSKVPAAAADALALLGLYDVPERGSLVATTAGLLRPARGVDRALLDLARLPPGPVLVPRSDHHGWDAATLARSLSDSDRARRHGLAFTPVDATITRFRDERPLANAELAARHDDAARLGWLTARLREVLARTPSAVAVLLPPWLGADRPRAETRSEARGRPGGAAACALASACGVRFERARDRAFATHGIEVRRTWVTRVRADEGRFRVECEDAEPVSAPAVILATGGLVGGGLAYAPGVGAPAGAPLEPRPTFRATLETYGAVGTRGGPLDLPGSLFGRPPESLAWPAEDHPLLERAGLLVGPDFTVLGAPDGLRACGDLVADRPRTWLDAWSSGASLAAAVRQPVAEEREADLDGEVLALRGVGR